MSCIQDELEVMKCHDDDNLCSKIGYHMGMVMVIAGRFARSSTRRREGLLSRLEVVLCFVLQETTPDLEKYLLVVEDVVGKESNLAIARPVS